MLTVGSRKTSRVGRATTTQLPLHLFAARARCGTPSGGQRESDEMRWSLGHRSAESRESVCVCVSQPAGLSVPARPPASQPASQPAGQPAKPRGLLVRLTARTEPCAVHRVASPATPVVVASPATPRRTAAGVAEPGAARRQTAVPFQSAVWPQASLTPSVAPELLSPQPMPRWRSVPRPAGVAWGAGGGAADPRRALRANTARSGVSTLRHVHLLSRAPLRSLRCFSHLSSHALCLLPVVVAVHGSRGSFVASLRDEYVWPLHLALSLRALGISISCLLAADLFHGDERQGAVASARLMIPSSHVCERNNMVIGIGSALAWIFRMFALCSVSVLCPV